MACVIGLCGYVARIFGMNLDNVRYLQPIQGVFNGVVISTIIFIPVMTLIIVSGLKKYDYLPM
jgi:phage shock protein PspC (stress-responsive transcriptional regulator)